MRHFSYAMVWDQRYVKLGHSATPRRRLASLRRGGAVRWPADVPVEARAGLWLFWVWPFDEERSQHRRWAEHRVAGTEFFDLPPLREWLEAEAGQPLPTTEPEQPTYTLPEPDPLHRIVYTLDEAAELLGTSLEVIEDHILTGALRPVLRAGEYRVRADELAEVA